MKSMACPVDSWTGPFRLALVGGLCLGVFLSGWALWPAVPSPDLAALSPPTQAAVVAPTAQTNADGASTARNAREGQEGQGGNGSPASPAQAPELPWAWTGFLSSADPSFLASASASQLDTRLRAAVAHSASNAQAFPSTSVRELMQWLQQQSSPAARALALNVAASREDLDDGPAAVEAASKALEAARRDGTLATSVIAALQAGRLPARLTPLIQSALQSAPGASGMSDAQQALEQALGAPDRSSGDASGGPGSSPSDALQVIAGLMDIAPAQTIERAIAQAQSQSNTERQAQLLTVLSTSGRMDTMDILLSGGLAISDAQRLQLAQTYARAQLSGQRLELLAQRLCDISTSAAQRTVLRSMLQAAEDPLGAQAVAATTQGC